MVLILTIPGAQQLQISFIVSQTVYEIREWPSKMGSWSAWVTVQILDELPWNVFSGILLFFHWYWTEGYSVERAGFAIVLLHDHWAGGRSYSSNGGGHCVAAHLYILAGLDLVRLSLHPLLMFLGS